MIKKANKITWVAILGFALACLYVTLVQGQTDEASPNMVPYMLKELNSLSEREGDLQERIDQLNEDIDTLKGLRGRLEALPYPTDVLERLKLLSEQPPTSESIGSAEDIVRSFHDPFLEILVSAPSTSVGSKSSAIYMDVESVVLAHEDDIIAPLFAMRSDIGLVKSPQDKAKLYQEAIVKLSKKLSSDKFSELKKKCVGIVDEKLQKMSRDQANDQKEMATLSKEIKKLGDSLQVSQQKQEKKQNLDEALFRWGLPVIIAFILLLTVINIIPRIVAMLIKNKDFAHEDNENEVLHTVTVFLLIISILILGIRGQIDNASLSTLLAGISGYVLGGQLKRRKEEGTRI